ncbi:MAG: hypothetical protein WC500_05280 [Candidatus Margulisiibacteriota bacterium]
MSVISRIVNRTPSLRARAMETMAKMKDGKNVLPRENRVFYTLTVVPTDNELGCFRMPTYPISVTEVTKPQKNYRSSKGLDLQWIAWAALSRPEAMEYLLDLTGGFSNRWGL